MNETILLDKYKVLKELKSNLNSTTYLVLDLITNKKYIIKQTILFKGNTKLLEILTNESKTLKNLNNSQIPKFIDFKILEDDYKTNIYLIQEYIEGLNLIELVEDGKRFSENDVIDILKQLIQVLEYLHNMSPPIIHQDIKPSNIILTADDKIYLIDFGAVNGKSIFTNDSGLSTIIGTQGYMPIEQFEGKIKPASDIYSLGLTIIYLLSRREPLQLDKDGLYFSFKEYINVSERLCKIIAKMVAPDWKRRFKSVEELKLNLNEHTENIIFDKKIDHIIKDNLTDKIYSYLNKDEDILWVSKPKWKRSLILSTIAIYTFAIPWTTFSIFWTIAASTAVLKSIFLIVFPMFGFPFIAIGLGMISIPYLFYKEMSSTTYIITNKRLLSIVLHNKPPAKWTLSLARKFRLNYVEQLKSFNFNELKNFCIEKKLYSNGYGDLKFITRDRHGDETKQIELIGIPEVNKVEKLIRELS